MKTKKFIKEVEAMGFVIDEYEGSICVKTVRHSTLAFITKDKTFAFSNGYDSFCSLGETKKQQLFNLLTEYASTPIEEREEEKKYRYYLKDTTGLNLNHGNLLYKQKGFNNFMFDIDNFNHDEVKCEFTHKELRACGINLTLLQENYEEIEVEE